MKYSTILLVLTTAVMVTGCSDQDSAKSAATAFRVPAMEKLILAPDLPLEIKGFPFELGGKCAIDLINRPEKGEVITISRAEGLKVDGWAFDEKHGTVPPVVVLQLAKGEDRYHALVNRHGGREDLTKVFGNPEFGDAGYAGAVDITSLPAGLYEILVVQRDKNKNLVCSTFRKVVVND